MAASPSTGASVIDGRYLASSAGIASRPAGPVEALDTRSGRAAQVRLVFPDGSWREDELAAAVARWCGLGCAEVCGVLDFGPHEDGWFLVLPPSLGVPLDRWRMIRRPTPGGAARLTVAVGGLLERVAAAGFPADALDVRDLAIGPGPTPFLDRPLLGTAGPEHPPATSPASGQRALARVLRAAAGDGMAEPLEAWAARAGARGFPTLSDAIDDLRRLAADADTAGLRPAEPDAELDSLFDFTGDPDLLLPPPDRWRPVRRLAAPLPPASRATTAIVAPRAPSAPHAAGRHGARMGLAGRRSPECRPLPPAPPPLAAGNRRRRWPGFWPWRSPLWLCWPGEGAPPPAIPCRKRGWCRWQWPALRRSSPREPHPRPVPPGGMQAGRTVRGTCDARRPTTGGLGRRGRRRPHPRRLRHRLRRPRH
ncbi:MAG TPA: hypothetical protein VM823_01580 [Gaiellales bacterium]|nr:hypothetical protein [Gaiellales bacterium]